MPNALLNLSILDYEICMKIQIPVLDFEIAFGQSLANFPTPETLKNVLLPYFSQHLQLKNQRNITWKINLKDAQISQTKDAFSNDYQELMLTFQAFPPDLLDLRNFTIFYDAVIHQVVTHKALVNVVADWKNGISNESKLLGIIELDIPTNTIPPISVSLEKGSTWKGLKSMVSLGIHHIAEGTDHLLFVLVLLLPAPLLAAPKSWGNFGGFWYSARRLLHIITAFTLGHSLTLLIGSLEWLRLPPTLVEVFIAFSIWVSAIHAIRPIFYGREIWIAGGFGCVHGLAFANILNNFELQPSQWFWSLLGFNVGIELMQLLVVGLFLPALWLLSQYKIYKYIRLEGAIFTLIVASGWIFERITNTPTFITSGVEQLRNYALHFAFFLFLFALIIHFYNFTKIKKAKSF
jgi:hypothetical protein